MDKKPSLTKGKGIFIIDLLLVVIFILVIYSGLQLHVADHETDHNIGEYWANYHVLASIASLILGWLHVKAHWNWYKGMVKKGIGNKSKITFAVSVLFVIEVVTGIILVFFINGPNSSVGLWHYKLGLVMIVFLTIHTISRFPLLIKGLRKRA